MISSPAGSVRAREPGANGNPLRGVALRALTARGARRLGHVFAIALTLLAAGVQAADAVTFARDSLEIETVDGRTFAFDVELAMTPAQRARGLMFREAVGDDEGMLFLFDHEAPRSFWMKNTPVALDLLFLDGGGTVVDIIRDTVPLDESLLSSPEPAAAVLELVAGTAGRLGLEIGDRVRHRAFR